MMGSRCLPLRQVVVVLLIVAGPARGDLAGSAAREVAERLGRGLRGTASRRAARHLDDVARVAARHTLAATPLRALSRAMPRLTPRNARRLTMLAEDGTLARTGRWSELLAVIERHGDRALDFTWRHKGALAVATVLGTFLADPEAFRPVPRDRLPTRLRCAAPVRPAFPRGRGRLAPTQPNPDISSVLGISQ